MTLRSVGNRVGIACLVVMVAMGVSATPTLAEASPANNGEKQVLLKDVPAPVRATIEKATAGSAVRRIVVEKEDGRDIYSVEASKSGKTKEYTIAADGTLLAEEEEVAFAKLPEAVRAAANKYFGDSQGLRAFVETEKGVTSYGIEGRKDGEDDYARFTSAGALIEEDEDGD